MDVDAEVSARLAAGDPGGAAACVVEGLGPGVLGYLVAILGSRDDGEEVFAQVVEQVLTGIAGFRGESTVKTWTYRIAWRTAMRFREDPHRRMQPLNSELASELAARVRETTATYRRTGARDWLAQVRAGLSPEEQSLLTLRIDRGLSWAEVGAVMGTGDDPAELARLRKQYERLKERLQEAARRDGLLD
jgi:RNA polymerase sigma-70 factor (ECF subfamily)